MIFVKLVFSAKPLLLLFSLRASRLARYAQKKKKGNTYITVYDANIFGKNRQTNAEFCIAMIRALLATRTFEFL
jgi:hypothetical protein